MANIAVIQTYEVPGNTIDVVVNKIVAEPTDPAYDGTYFVEIPDGVMCDIGWIWDGVTFSDPTPPAQPEPIPDEEVI